MGAATYTDQEIAKFLKSRELVLNLLQQKANVKEVRGGLDATRITTFTFDDTVLIVYQTTNAPTLRDVEHFCLLLRKFQVDSLAQGILFRGAVSIGHFYVDDNSNTVMGTAVTDAAAWYDAADWVGILATPHATLVIESLLPRGADKLDHLLVDYSVPLKDNRSFTLKAINWPKAFMVKGLRPVEDDEDPRAKCLELLTNHRVPKATESKHFNSLKFFEYCIDQRKKKQKARK